jgi:hypothetical protein
MKNLAVFSVWSTDRRDGEEKIINRDPSAEALGYQNPRLTRRCCC